MKTTSVKRREPTMVAYRKGYNDGKNEGIDNNPYDRFVSPSLYRQYRYGYDAGMIDYSREK
jgi:hypothetical protein